MTLGNLLSVDQILPEMQSKERWSAIVELVDLLVAQPPVARKRHADFVAVRRQGSGKRFEHIAEAAGARQRSHLTASEENFHGKG